MKLVLASIVLCVAIYVASATKVLASSSRELNRRETNLFKRIFKRQAYGDPSCKRHECAIPNCGKDFVAANLPGECCERCVPWEYAQSLGVRKPQAPQAVQDPRYQQRPYEPQYQQNRASVYIYGPDEGARVSTGQSIYFDCEVNAPYNQNVQPQWTRSGNQPLPYKSQSRNLPGNRKLARLTIPDATHSDAGRYECSAGTGNPADQTSIELQVTDGGYYPRPQPQPQPQPQPNYPNYDPYNQYPYNQPGYNPPQPQPQPQPYPYPQPQPQPQPYPQPAGGDEDENDDDAGADDEPTPGTTAASKHTPAPAPAPPAQEEGGEEEGEYPEDYSDNEKK